MPSDSASSVPQPRCNVAVRHRSQQQQRSPWDRANGVHSGAARSDRRQDHSVSL